MRIGDHSNRNFFFEDHSEIRFKTGSEVRVEEALEMRFA